MYKPKITPNTRRRRTDFFWLFFYKKHNFSAVSNKNIQKISGIRSKKHFSFTPTKKNTEKHDFIPILSKNTKFKCKILQYLKQMNEYI